MVYELKEMPLQQPRLKGFIATLLSGKSESWNWNNDLKHLNTEIRQLTSRIKNVSLSLKSRPLPSPSLFSNTPASLQGSAQTFKQTSSDGLMQILVMVEASWQAIIISLRAIHSTGWRWHSVIKHYSYLDRNSNSSWHTSHRNLPSISRANLDSRVIWRN